MSELKGFKAGWSWVGCWPWFWNLFRSLHPCHLQTSYLHGLSEHRVPQKPLLCHHFPYQKNLLAGFTDVYPSFSAKSVLDPLSIQLPQFWWIKWYQMISPPDGQRLIPLLPAWRWSDGSRLVHATGNDQIEQPKGWTWWTIQIYPDWWKNSRHWYSFLVGFLKWGYS